MQTAIRERLWNRGPGINGTRPHKMPLRDVVAWFINHPNTVYDDGDCLINPYIQLGTGNYPLVYWRGHTAKLAKMVLVWFRGYRKKPFVMRHTCHNRLCFNPEHLIWGTSSDNSRNMLLRHRHNRQKLSADEAVEMYRRRKDGETLTALASEYGVCVSQVCRIGYGKSWGWLTQP